MDIAIQRAKNLMLKAANRIEADAHELRSSCSVNGEWRFTGQEDLHAMEIYNEDLKLAADLRVAARWLVAEALLLGQKESEHRALHGTL